RLGRRARARRALMRNPAHILAERWLDLGDAVRALAELVQMPSAADAYPPLAGQSARRAGPSSTYRPANRPIDIDLSFNRIVAPSVEPSSSAAPLDRRRSHQWSRSQRLQSVANC